MKKHIILIEDDMDDLKIFLDAVKEVPGSFKCTYASCPAKGLNMLQYLDADYIFVDYNLPVMNGLEVLKEIKADEKFAGTPTYLYTSLLNDKLRVAATALGAANCIQKPNSVNGMVEILSGLLAPNSNPGTVVYAKESISPEARWGRSGNNFYKRGG